MTPDRWQHVQALVASAADLPLFERTAWLEQACAEDVSLLAQVRHMLAAYNTLDDGLEQAVGAAAFHVSSFASAYAPGDRIGAYRITAVLGQGGMGVVYRGERADDQFRQAVALKVVRAGFGSAETLLTRFRVERQLLAGLDHPHIARLLDGGLTATGLPFLTMEFVDGVDLLRYAAAHQLSLAGRLELFQQIGTAVQYAHANLIVHRDLKPGNILVTAEGRAKLLDFGIAKLLEPQYSDQTVVETEAAERLMTPEYASPEQIRGERITTATDVYGLGMLLYELLTGRRPFQLAELSRAEAERLICEAAPPPPSTFGLPAEASGSSRIEPDLDRIVLKALHKQPSRRYAAAADLLADLGRFEAGFPVLARPDSLRYRAGKFIQRHRWGVLATVAFFVIVIGLSITLAFQARRARHEAASAEAVSQYLVGLFDNSQPDATQGRSVTARQLLDQGTARLNTDWQGEPLVKGRLLSTLGSVYYQLGDFGRARDLLAQAEELYRRNAGPDTSEVADLANSLGEAELDGGDYPGSLRDYTDSVRIFERIRPNSAELADAMDGLSGILWKLGRYPESEQYHLRSVAMASRVLGPDAPMTLVDKNNYAVLLEDMGRYPEAEAIHREVLAARLKQFGLNNSHTASTYCNLGVVLESMGRLHEARQALETSLHIRQAIYPGGHPNIGISLGYLSSLYRDVGDMPRALQTGKEALAVVAQFDGQHSLDAANAEDNLGQTYLEAGDLAEARRWTERAFNDRQQNDPTSVPGISESLDHRGLVELAEGRPAAAQLLLEQALNMRRRFYGDGSDRTAASRAHLGRALLALGKPALAADQFRSALPIAQQHFGDRPHPLSAEVDRGLGQALLAQNDSQGTAWLERARVMQASLVQQGQAP